MTNLTINFENQTIEMTKHEGALGLTYFEYSK